MKILRTYGERTYKWYSTELHLVLDIANYYSVIEETIENSDANFIEKVEIFMENPTLDNLIDVLAYMRIYFEVNIEETIDFLNEDFEIIKTIDV